VVGEWAGLRPSRTGVRLDSEEMTFGSRTVKVWQRLLLLLSVHFTLLFSATDITDLSATVILIHTHNIYWIMAARRLD